MPRDELGLYTLPEAPFDPTEVIRSAEVNSNFSDIGSALTSSISTNGVSNMSGPFKGFSGTEAAPGYTFVNNVSAGIYLVAAGVLGFVAGGQTIFNVNSSGISIAPTKSLSVPSLEINGVGNQGFFAGTAMLFIQSAAPTGWTKSTQNDKILRVVNVTATVGGLVAFTSVFTTLSINGAIGGTELDLTQIPNHNHFLLANITVSNFAPITATNQFAKQLSNSSNWQYIAVATSLSPNTTLSSSVGDNVEHNHTFSSSPIDMNVEYVDVIMAVKA